MPTGVWSDPVVIPGILPGNPDIIFRMACVRLGDNNPLGRPYYHYSSTHAKVGIEQWGFDEAVHLNAAGNLVIDGTPLASGESVAALIPMPDESMSKKRIMAGGSGSAEECTIQLYSSTDTLISPRDVLFNSNLFNIWFLSVAVRDSDPGAGGSGGMLGWINDQDLSTNPTVAALEARIAALEVP